jgi:hypothetical protein
LDTEFHEDGKTIDLISLALVPEPSATHLYAMYWVSSEFDEARCSDWVKANVLPKLPVREQWRPRSSIATGVRELLLGNVKRDGEPELWGYYADYDWVAFCQLFGRMIDLPNGMPMFCRDLIQLMKQHGIRESDLPKQAAATEHDALGDAAWTAHAYEYVQMRIRA